MTMSAPLVGVHYRQGGALWLRYLPKGATLWLEPEPENAYDSNAVKVMVEPSAVQELHRAALCREMPGSGLDPTEFFVDVESEVPRPRVGGVISDHPDSAAPRFFLGYIARTHSEAVTTGLAQGGLAPEATLGFDLKGKPVVELMEAALEAK